MRENARTESQDRQPLFVDATRQWKPAATLLHAARSLRQLALDHEPASHWVALSGIVMLAFSVEGFCQTYGERLFSTEEWVGVDRKGIERKPVKDKLRLIGKKVGVSVDFGQKPWSDIHALLQVRDALAHPRPMEKRVAQQFWLSHEESQTFLTKDIVQFDWEILSQPVVSEQLQTNVETALSSLLTAMGVSTWELDSMGTGSYMISKVRTKSEG